MENFVFRVSGPASTMPDIAQLTVECGGKSSAPQPASSSAEPLNAPISGGDIQSAVQVVTAVFSAATAATKFIEALWNLSKAKKARIKAQNVQTAVTRELTTEKDVKELMP